MLALLAAVVVFTGLAILVLRWAAADLAGPGALSTKAVLAATVVLARDGDVAGPRTRRLVTAGPYRLSRHPQSLGWGIMLLGVAVAGRSLVALVLVGLFAAFAERYARLEERQLRQDFDASCDEYRARTPAVLALGQLWAARPSAPPHAR